MTVKHLHILLALASVPPKAIGQDTPRPVETLLLSTLARDTTSILTAYLPPAYRFGLGADPKGRYLLVKDGAYTRLLLEGTHRVYEIDTRGATPRLNRIDATLFEGDNCNPIALHRKDTLLQYGGRGRFTQRDFFIRYREGTRDWEIVPHKGRTLENAWTLHQYDPYGDALLVIGSRDIDHRDLHGTIRDSVFRFDFPTGQWTSLGRLSDSLPFQPFHKDIAHHSVAFPGGTFLRLGSDLLLIDIPQNRWCRIPASRWWNPAYDFDSGDTTDLLFLPFDDSLHQFQSSPQGPIHRSHPFPFQPWLAEGRRSVYGPVGKGPSAPVAVWGSLTALALVTAAIGWRKRRGPSPASTIESGSATSSVEGTRHEVQATHLHPEAAYRPATGSSTAGQGQDRLSDFLAEGKSRLTTPEWQLLTLLIQRSAEGGMLDTATVNTALGVGQKDPSVQKTRRNMTISRINRLFTQTVGAEGPLVQLERNAFDRRSFRYGIREERAAALAKAQLITQTNHGNIG